MRKTKVLRVWILFHNATLKLFKSCHLTLSEGYNMYHLGNNMSTFGTNMYLFKYHYAQRCACWKGTTPVTAFVPVCSECFAMSCQDTSSKYHSVSSVTW